MRFVIRDVFPVESEETRAALSAYWQEADRIALATIARKNRLSESRGVIDSGRPGDKNSTD